MIAWAAVVLAGAMQAAPPAREYLWREIYAGMSLAQLKAAYPGYKASLSPDCPIRVLSTYKQGGLRTVVLKGRDRQAACSQRLIDDLDARHGPGAVKFETQSSLPLGVLTRTFQRKDITWTTPNRIMVMSIMPGKVPGYLLSYRVRADGDP